MTLNPYLAWVMPEIPRASCSSRSPEPQAPSQPCLPAWPGISNTSKPSFWVQTASHLGFLTSTHNLAIPQYSSIWGTWESLKPGRAEFCLKSWALELRIQEMRFGLDTANFPLGISRAKDWEWVMFPFQRGPSHCQFPRIPSSSRTRRATALGCETHRLKCEWCLRDVLTWRLWESPSQAHTPGWVCGCLIPKPDWALGSPTNQLCDVGQLTYLLWVLVFLFVKKRGDDKTHHKSCHKEWGTCRMHMSSAVHTLTLPQFPLWESDEKVLLDVLWELTS